MDLHKPIPNQRQPGEDTVVWARKETIAFASWKCKVYGVVFVAGCILEIPFFAGMPLHEYWKWAGLPLLLVMALYPFPCLLYWGGRLIFELLDRPKPSTQV